MSNLALVEFDFFWSRLLVKSIMAPGWHTVVQGTLDKTQFLTRDAASLLAVGSFLLTVGFFKYSCVWELFCLQLELFYLQLELCCLLL